MNGSLFLTPQNPASKFHDLQALKLQLVKDGLILDRDNNPYTCGDEFAKLIIFMGCSPHLLFEPPEDGSDNYCHIILHQYTSAKLFTGSQTSPPRCPACRYRIADWKQTLNTTHWHCPECGHDTDIFHLDWKQNAGAGSLLIEIKNIFPGEAVPVDSLLNALKGLSGEKWRYFYTTN